MAKASVVLEALALLLASAAAAVGHPSSPDTSSAGGVYHNGVFVAGPSYIDPQEGGWFYGDVGDFMQPYSPPSGSFWPSDPGWDFSSGSPTNIVNGDDGGSHNSGGSSHNSGAPGNSGAGSSGNLGSGGPSDPDDHFWPGTTNDILLTGGGNPGGSDGDYDGAFAGGSNPVVSISAPHLDPDAAVIPEPSTLGLLGTGLLGFLSFRRRSARPAEPAERLIAH